MEIKNSFKICKQCPDWRAVLIDSYCQAGKTWKCFDIIAKKIIPKTLVLFVTQANSTVGATQILQRSKNSNTIKNVIKPYDIFRSNVLPDVNDLIDKNYMIVDYWNSRNMTKMFDFVDETKEFWKQIIIVVDEVEQGGLKGIKDRLCFVRKIEQISKCLVNIIMITATVANLSKCIIQIAKENNKKFATGLLFDLINNPVVEHHFATPHETYVGASWFLNKSTSWNRLVMPLKSCFHSQKEYNDAKIDEIMKAVKKLPLESKELCLVATSTRTDEHANLANKLYLSGFNVCVELNSTNCKDYNVKYINEACNISSWKIPYKLIETLADKGDLSKVKINRRKYVDTDIIQKEDITLSHVLQAALFMDTDAEDRIESNISQSEYYKLSAISDVMMKVKSVQRPIDYPTQPRVVLIAGNMAGRGITIQNPFIDFTCTSFCFTETKDIVQRGASNAQKFGRSCGMLRDVFARPGRSPILIATSAMVNLAVANEQALREKAEKIQNGVNVALKDLVTNADWNRIIREVKHNMNKRGLKSNTTDVIDGVNIADLKRYFKSENLLIGKMLRYLYKQNKPIRFDQFKEGIQYTKNEKQFLHNISTGRAEKSMYGKLWICENNTIIMNNNIRNIIIENK